MMIDFTRDLGDPWANPPLTWRPMRMKEGGPLVTATAVCSNEHSGSLESHEISEDGTVTPSVDCSIEGCDFHDHIRLVGWEEREIK